MINITTFRVKSYIPYQSCNGLDIQLCKDTKGDV